MAHQGGEDIRLLFFTSLGDRQVPPGGTQSRIFFIYSYACLSPASCYSVTACVSSHQAGLALRHHWTENGSVLAAEQRVSFAFCRGTRSHAARGLLRPAAAVAVVSVGGGVGAARLRAPERNQAPSPALPEHNAWR